MRIGIFGGTFDPPHVGHLLAATDAFEALALDRVIFIPVAQQPLKAGTTMASGVDRLAMVRALVGTDPRFTVDPIEIDRGGLSFTVETLQVLRERWRDDRDLALFLLLGSDAVAMLPKWREPETVASLAEIVVLARSGPTMTDRASRLSARTVSARRVDVSSTEIRDRARNAKPLHGFVPDRVAEYIAGASLYR